jgi:L-ascorbate metabolism protein UlaG (beta-lactamase superfamily)
VSKKTWRRKVVRWLGLPLLLLASALLVLAWPAFGHTAEGTRRARMERSPQWRDGQFHNPEPIVNDIAGMLGGLFDVSPVASPAATFPTARVDPALFARAPASGLRVTWFGHSSILLEIDGHRVLTDPMWSEHSSPLSFIGPTRWFAPPIALGDLPGLDAVVISHDHYDHLDYRTLRAMKSWKTTFVVPLGLGAILEGWGIAHERIVELDWWERTKVRGLEIVCTPARHASGRTPFDRDENLWGGYALLGSTHRAYYSGDTGLFPGMREIGARLGPFDVTLIESGQYNRTWPDWHVGPEQAVAAHRMVQGRVLVPVHWGLLQLAYHGWTEPVERVLAEAARHQIRVLTPKPGQSVEPTTAAPIARWWPELPWETGQQAPIVSSQVPAE